MALKGRSYSNKGNSRQSEVKPQFFSPKPPKADLRQIKEKLANGSDFLRDFLAMPNPDGRLWTKNDEEEGTVVAFYSIGRVAKDSPDRIIIGRGSTIAKAIAVVAHWVQTLEITYMFPEEEEDDEQW